MYLFLRNNSQTIFIKVFRGKVEMNSTLEEISTCLYTGRVPVFWINMSPQTVKSLARYIEHLEKRTLQYSTWVNNYYLTVTVLNAYDTNKSM